MLKYLKALFTIYPHAAVDLPKLEERFDYTRDGMDEYGAANAEISRLEAKSGTLLTHISLMIAITGIFFVSDNSPSLYEIFLGIELVAYLILALLAIRCQFQIGTKHFERVAKGDPKSQMEKGQWKKYYHKAILAEVFFREKLFHFVFYAVYILTVALVITIITAIIDASPASPSTFGVTS